MFLDFALISGLLVVAHLLRSRIRLFQAILLFATLLLSKPSPGIWGSCFLRTAPVAAPGRPEFPGQVPSRGEAVDAGAHDDVFRGHGLGRTYLTSRIRLFTG